MNIPPVSEEAIHKALKAIKENDGFPGKLKDNVRANIIDKWATVEVSLITGMDIQWRLTTGGKQRLRILNRDVRYREKHKNWSKRRNHQTDDVVVPITVEVLDALKSIRETGDPKTTKLDIVARIQRNGAHGAVTTLNGREYITKYGALAHCADGVWTLTEAGKRAEAGHIRKDKCAQFTGKVR